MRKNFREFGFLKPSFGLLILIAIVAAVIYGLINWQKTASFFGFGPYKNVELVDLLSFANFYSGKRVCTRGYYTQSQSLMILKVSMDGDELERSLWVNNSTGKEIIANISGLGDRYIEAKLCGIFESRRGGNFGKLGTWNHQLTVEKLEMFGDSLPFTGFSK